MKYIVECRKRNDTGNIEVYQHNGCGYGLPDKKTAKQVYEKEVKSNMWDAVYIDKIQGRNIFTVETWYKE